MIILLDIDGVLVTQPSWKKVEIAADGFMLFNKQSAENLASILSVTNASVVLTTTHRISYTLDKWKDILKFRGIHVDIISKLNGKTSITEMMDRGTEINEWVKHNKEENYVIIDDDKSINNLPVAIKDRWVVINPFEGIDDNAKQKALDILLNQSR